VRVDRGAHNWFAVRTDDAAENDLIWIAGIGRYRLEDNVDWAARGINFAGVFGQVTFRDDEETEEKFRIE
jgi:hypothetical protein